MARQRRMIQIARHMLPLAGKDKTTVTDWEKKRDQANKLLYRKHGIPNAVQLGHALSTQLPLGGKERASLGTPIKWPGLPVLAPVGASRGEIIEVCSPGQICRDVAAQMALAEARSGSVFWMAVGSHAAAYGSSVLQQVPNLTLHHRTIETAADSRAALQDLLRIVRRQAYTMVVLDGIAGLAPRPTGALAWRAAAAAAGAAPLPSHAMAAASAAAAAAMSPGTPWSPAAVAAAGTPAAADLVERFGATAMSRNIRAAAAAAAGSRAHAWTDPLAAWHPAALAPSVGSAVPNFKFLYNVLPLLLEETLAQLAASCGPELRTTTLLLNPYAERERQGAGAGAGEPQDSTGAGWRVGGAARHRWARRAILRHVSATLHVVPEVSGSAAVGGGAGGPQLPDPVRCLRAVLSKGRPSGEDGPALRTWSLNTPVRLASPASNHA